MFSAEFFDVVDISKNCALIVIFVIRKTLLLSISRHLYNLIVIVEQTEQYTQYRAPHVWPDSVRLFLSSLH